jgi:MFS family permease
VSGTAGAGRDERLMTPAFLGISASVLGFFVASGMFLPATPRFTAGPLGGNDLAVGLVVGSFSISSLILRPFAGRWADQRGRRVMLIVGAALQVVAAAGHLVADSVILLVLMRLLLGAAEAIFFVGGMAAATDLAPERRRGEAISLISTSLYLGVAVGPVLAEWLYGVSGGYAAIWIGATVISGAAVAISWVAPETLPPAERRRPGATTSLLHRRGLVPGLLVLCGAWGMGAYFAFLPLLGVKLGLQGVGGYFAAFALVVIGLRIVFARLPDQLGPARLSGTALVLSATGMTIAGLFPSELGLWAATIVFGVGVAFTFPAIVALSVMGVPPDERGAVVGTTTLFIDVAFGLSPALLGLLAVSTGYPATFLVSGVVAAVGAAWLLVPGRAWARSRALPAG